MLHSLIHYFAQRHLLTNLLCAAVFIGGVISWQQMKKEEMPDITFDTVRISARYPGATAEEVEHFLTREIEEAVRGLDGVYRVISAVSQGATTVSVELQPNYPDKDQTIMEIRQAVLSLDLPEDVRDDPTVRVFKTAQKGIVDIALIDTSAHLLDIAGRQRLQEYAAALENALLNEKSVNSIRKSGYLQEEIQINVDPAQLVKYRIPLSKVRDAVAANHIRQPAGNLEAPNEPKVTLDAQLDTPEKLNDVLVQAGFDGQAVSLGDVAQVQRAFARTKEIIKVNGHEAVIFYVVKNSSYGILESLSAVENVVERFAHSRLKDTPLTAVVLDDESIDVRNRLSIIASNGGLGFILVVLILFLFLNKRSGLWVALGLPFSICFTLICGALFGYTINNTTLAAVIIVLGIVVDDAIVVAENITRLRFQGKSSREAAIDGTLEVFLPVLASLVTTAAAFIPLLFFGGRYGRLNSFIPPVIFMMLGASLFESLIILPGHMRLEFTALRKFFAPAGGSGVKKQHWFDRVENAYGRALERVLPFKYVVLALFVVLLLGSLWIMREKMRFVIFPDEETREITISGDAPPHADRFATATLTQKVEEIIQPYIGKEVVGLTTEIARSRRGGAVEENRFRTIVEIVPKEKRKRSADQLVALWKSPIEAVDGLEKLTIQKSRWGQSSGSALEILVLEHNDEWREAAASALAEKLRAYPYLINVDIERALRVAEYKIGLQREKIKRLSINPDDIKFTLRTALEGAVLYELPKGTEEIDVRLSVVPEVKTSLDSVLTIPVENSQQYLVPLGDIVSVTPTTTLNTISRQNQKRVTTVYADLRPKSSMTPLEAAAVIEREVFPALSDRHPSTSFGFAGEVYDTRESQGELGNSIFVVLMLIFVILSVLFNSLLRPLIVMLAIPFGLVGVVLTFWLHGKVFFGLFAAIGCLGLAGVVINDAIVLIAKLDAEFRRTAAEPDRARIARISQTRLRAITLTTLTTVAGVLPTAYGFFGYDAMLADMMLALSWGLAFGTMVTLLFVPCLYSVMQDIRGFFCRGGAAPASPSGKESARAA
ncbi:MAG: efflux RND transporter permease subunit [Candidatus Omnitrophica bacterium]|nr:efflux RND transporter permease subunit [Candidatus Omnitrophota bacterium]